MKSWKRWLIVIGGSLASGAILGAALLAYLVLRLDVRTEVERAVEAATGRDLVISGSVGVSYWPVLGLRVSDATLSNVEGGRAPVFIAADEIDIGVELGPLLNRDVEVRRLVLQRPRIALEVDAEGRPNWILTPRRAEGPPPTTPTQPAGRTSLREVRVNEGEISYFDARQGQGWVIGEADLTSAVTSLEEPIRVAGDFRYNDRPVGIDLRIERPGAASRGQVSPLRMELQSDLLTVSFDGQTMAASGEIAGAVRASGPSLRQMAAWVGSPVQGGVGLERFAVAGRLAVAGGRYDFSNAGFAVDLVRGRGDFVLSELRGKPYVSGRLELFDFDLNPYITGQAPSPDEAPPAAQTAAGPTPTAEIAAVEAPPRAIDAQAAPTETPMDFSGLHAFNADLELVTAAVLVQHMRVESSRANLVINDGYMAATLHSLGLYSGTGRGRFEIDASTPGNARMVYDLAFDRVDAQRFLTDAVNFTNIEGRAEVSLNIRTQGRTQSEMIAAADGAMHIEVVSGTLHGVDLGGVSTTIRNALRGELIAPEARTPFQGFSATFAIADGVLASDDVSFNTTDLRIPGVGVIDLPNRRADMRLAPRSPRGGIVFPFAVRGPWGQLTYNADLNDLAQNEILTRVRQVEAASRVRE